MTAQIIDGKKIAQDIRAETTLGVGILQRDYGVTPGLAAVLVGDDPASAVYVRNKGRACEEVGIFNQTFHLPKETSQQELLDLVGSLNSDIRFDGILVQLPLPDQMDPRAIILALDPNKDVDGLHPVNVGRLVAGTPRFGACTPSGVQQMLLRSGLEITGKHLVVCGRSDIVGKPLAIMMMQKFPGANATVTVCHTGTRDLASITRQADILVAAMGKPRVITSEMVSDGVVVIDVGTNRVDDPTAKRGYRLVGDVDFENVKEKAAAISPVPGGVGPMTIAMLLANTLKSAQLKLGINGL